MSSTAGAENEQPGDLPARAWGMFDSIAADWLLGLVGAEQLVGCAVAALAVGCDSRWLASIAALREEDRGAILTGLNGAFRERGLEFPLRDDALKLSADAVLALVLSGAVSPEQASVKLCSVADRDADGSFPELAEFRELALSLSLHDDPECDFDLDVSEWRAQLLEAAGRIIDRGGIGAGELESGDDCDRA